MVGLLSGGHRLPGLFGPPVAPPIRQTPIGPTPGINPDVRLPVQPMPLLERLKMTAGQVLTGGDHAGLSAAQNDDAARLARVMAGAQMLAASSQGAGFGEALASGLMAGQGTGAQAREQAYLSTQEERIRQALANPAVVGKLSPEQMAMIQLLPPQEAVKMLTSVAFAPAPEAKVVSEGGALVDGSGKVIFQNERAAGGPELPAEIDAAIWRMGLDPSQMTPEERAAAFQLGEQYRRSGATTVNVNGERRQDFADTNTLATAFERDIADHQTVASSYGTVLSAAQDPSAAGDLALIFAYMKMLDPGSVVREGEFATAQNAASVPERVRAQYNRALNGERFSPDTRNDFVDRARRIAESRQGQIKPILNRYRRRAEAGGVDPGLVVYDPFEEIGGTAAPASQYSPDNPFVR